MSYFGSPPAVLNDTAVQLLKDQLLLNTTLRILTGSADPTTSATLAEAGSLYLRTNGNLYVKQDAGTTTNWTQMGAGGGSGVTSFNTLVGAVTISAGNNITLTPSGNNIAIAATTGGVVSPGSYPYTSSSTDYGKVILVDTSAARTITLPPHSSGKTIALKDVTGSASTNNITIARNGGTGSIDGISASVALSANWGWYTFISDGTNWWRVG